VVDVLSRPGLSLVARLDAAGAPSVAASDQASEAYTVTSGGELVGVQLTPPTATPVAQVASSANALLFSTSSNALFVAAPDSGQVVEIDVAHNTAVADISAGPGADAMAMTLAGPL
jgi:hypothetical protein